MARYGAVTGCCRCATPSGGRRPSSPNCAYCPSISKQRWMVCSCSPLRSTRRGGGARYAGSSCSVRGPDSPGSRPAATRRHCCRPSWPGCGRMTRMCWWAGTSSALIAGSCSASPITWGCPWGWGVLARPWSGGSATATRSAAWRACQAACSWMASNGCARRSTASRAFPCRPLPVNCWGRASCCMAATGVARSPACSARTRRHWRPTTCATVSW